SYAIVWMPRRTLAAATNMTGAFNQLTVRVTADASQREAQAELISEIDRLLSRWGGGNTINRNDQLSWRFLSDELQQLGTLTRLFPAIFLSVAAFLLNVVFTRLIGTQRAQIAILKAFGYSTRDVMLHYGLMSALICLLGALIGMGAGTWLGQHLAALYQTNFRFPYLDFRVNVDVGLIGIAISLLAAVGGTGHAVLRAAREPVAQAMRPVAPERYKPTLPERLGLARWLSQPARMVLRQVERRPWRATFSIIGLALAGAIMMLARFQSGTLLYMIDIPSRLQQHEDIVVSFTEQTAPRALHELRALPGVQHVEGTRSVPVKLRHGTVTLSTGIEGISPDSHFRRVLTRQHHPVALPDDGLMISTYMAQRLGVRLGDPVWVEVLTGKRAQRLVTISALFHEDMGMLAIMNRHALDRLTGDGSVVDGALLSVLPEARASLLQRLNDVPGVASANARLEAIDAFMETFDQITGPFTWISLILGVIVNFGVVYNAARITLAERARELASLRVLGFSQGEVARILLGEMALLVLLSLPLSCLAGLALSWLIVQGSQSDLYRIPLHVPLSNYTIGMLVTLLSSLASALIILRQVRRLDMIEALKTHE
ncbi:MAG: ABC transporter permease, partial [Lautropia sp.]|nr:ABC transporter permease [Lautropia sp.]